MYQPGFAVYITLATSMSDLTLQRLLEHGFDFLTFGLRLILSPNATPTDTKVSVANIQVGLELLIN